MNIIASASTASTTKPTAMDGLANTVGSPGATPAPPFTGHSKKRQAATNSPVSASPAINPEAVSTPAFSTRAFCASL